MDGEWMANEWLGLMVDCPFPLAVWIVDGVDYTMDNNDGWLMDGDWDMDGADG